MTRNAILVISGAILIIQPVFAASSPTGFGTPQEAVQAVIQACEKNDTGTLLKLFGPDGKNIVESGNKSEDKTARARFAELAHQKLNLVADPMNPDKMIISIGSDDWPFPVPLVRKDQKWMFDSAQGSQEILARRIGHNEMTAMEVARGYVEAQFDYAQGHRKNGVPEYAQKIVSSKNKQDGLYWESGKNTPGSTIPKGFAKAAAGMADAHPEPYHGYYFKVLTAQGPNAHGGAVNYVVNGTMMGGFALIAWPAQYGVTGVQTFMVNNEGTVYEKALGPDTAKIAAEMTQFDPDSTWRPVQPDLD